MAGKGSGWHGDRPGHSRAGRKGWEKRRRYGEAPKKRLKRRRQPSKSYAPKIPKIILEKVSGPYNIVDVPHIGKFRVKLWKGSDNHYYIRTYATERLITGKTKHKTIALSDLSHAAINRAIFMGVNAFGIPIPDEIIVRSQISQIVTEIAKDLEII